MRKPLSVLLLGAALAISAQGASAESSQAATLRAKHAAVADSLRNNPYRRPMRIESAENGNALSGDVYAVVGHPFATVSDALTRAAPWCDIMIMPINTKDCRIGQKGGAPTLTMRIGRKSDQPLKDAYPIEFVYRVADKSADYFAARLEAEDGPISTRDYRVLVEATPLEGDKTFLHLHYSYAYGGTGRFAMQAYLATVGAGKVGFSTVDGKLTGGMRGVIERNTMRYYLAIDAYLAASTAPPAERLDRRLQTWFDSTEQYARQLHEIDRAEYMAMKRREVQRQGSPIDTATSGTDRTGRL